MFGRLDFEAVARALYVGRRWVHDADGKPMVVNWQAPAARPSPAPSLGVGGKARNATQSEVFLQLLQEASKVTGSPPNL